MNIDSTKLAAVLREAFDQIPRPGYEVSSQHRAYSEGRRNQHEDTVRRMAREFERQCPGLSFDDFIVACGVRS